MDQAVLRRVYPTSIITALIVASIFMANDRFDWGLGVMVGNLMGLGLLKATEVMVQKFIEQKSKKVVLVFWSGKLIIAAALIYLFVKFPVFNTVSFVIGFVLVQLVIVLKSIGRSLFAST